MSHIYLDEPRISGDRIAEITSVHQSKDVSSLPAPPALVGSAKASEFLYGRLWDPMIPLKFVHNPHTDVPKLC